MAFSSSSHGPTAAEINVTPLIDVLLVLLMIFMTITPTLPRALPTSIPKPNPGPAAETQPIVLEVLTGAPARYRLNGTEGSLAVVKARLHTAFANRASADRVLFLRADRELAYSDVASAAGMGRESGASAIAVTTSAQQK